MDDKDTLDQIIAGAIDHDKIQTRGIEGEKLAYAPNKQKPYTGWVKSMHDNGQVAWLGQCKDGKVDGLMTLWYKNGQKQEESTYKDDKLMTSVVWQTDGEKCPVTNDVNGNGVKVAYLITGEELFRETYKDGQFVSMK